MSLHGAVVGHSILAFKGSEPGSELESGLETCLGTGPQHVQYTLYSIPYTVYLIQYTLYSIHILHIAYTYTLYSILCTIYHLQYTVYSILCRVHLVPYAVHRILYTVGISIGPGRRTCHCTTYHRDCHRVRDCAFEGAGFGIGPGAGIGSGGSRLGRASLHW